MGEKAAFNCSSVSVKQPTYLIRIRGWKIAGARGRESSTAEQSKRRAGGRRATAREDVGSLMSVAEQERREKVGWNRRQVVSKSRRFFANSQSVILQYSTVPTYSVCGRIR